MLKFIDDTQISFFGLDETLAEFYDEGKPANDETIEEIMTRLEEFKNYIPSSDRARKDYGYMLLNEYRRYIKEQNEKVE